MHPARRASIATATYVRATLAAYQRAGPEKASPQARLQVSKLHSFRSNLTILICNRLDNAATDGLSDLVESHKNLTFTSQNSAQILGK